MCTINLKQRETQDLQIKILIVNVFFPITLAAISMYM